MSVKISFGMQNNLLIHIADANRGLDCNCVCLECGDRLSAKKGDINEHHFSHYNQVDSHSCLGGTETALHKYAKQLIEKAGYLELPSFKVSLPFPDNVFTAEIAARRAVFERVTIEERMTFGRRRIDVVGYEPDGRILIEIFVSHRVKGKKLNDVKIAEETMIEIQIQREVMFPNGVLITEGLDKLILDSHTNKRWLFHPKAKELEINLKQKVEEQRNEFYVNQKQNIEYKNFQEPSNHIKLVNPQRSLSLPSRSEYSPKDYVVKMYEFLVKAYPDCQKRTFIISRLRLDSSISKNDDEIAKNLGLLF